MRASELPAWGWFLISGMLLFAFLDGVFGFIGGPSNGRFDRIAEVIVLAASAICALIGLIRFVKWAWKD